MTLQIEDKNMKCISAIFTMSIGDYISLVEEVYQDSGGIEGQRSALKTKTAIRIRQRMVSDIEKGAVLPPIVIGAVVGQSEYNQALEYTDEHSYEQLATGLAKDKLSIIDGMQRTTAIRTALENNFSCSSNQVRIELWLAQSVDRLIYRMLILNAGQVPWDIKRQLSAVYKPILSAVKTKIPDISIFGIADNTRRSQGGQYQGSTLIECFLAFTSRKAHLDIKEKIAEDFERINATEAVASDKFLDHFITVFDYMSKFDREFSKAIIREGEDSPEGKLANGKDIFTSAPAAIGFVAAAAIEIYGRPGFERSEEDQRQGLEMICSKMENLLTKLRRLSPEEMHDFLDLYLLNERIQEKSGKVGEFERNFYKESFKVILQEGDALSNLTPCWSAH